jgi:urease accessory protein
MQLIHDHLHDVSPALGRVALAVDRLTLAKRRWRGEATDGREFGFDLEYPLGDGDIFHTTDSVAYVIAQKAETVLEVSLADDPAAAARLGWVIGNLHFQLEVAGAVIRVADDPALRQLFEREHVHYHEREAVFRPLGGGHSHGHHHH